MNTFNKKLIGILICYNQCVLSPNFDRLQAMSAYQKREPLYLFKVSKFDWWTKYVNRIDHVTQFNEELGVGI